MSGWLPNLSLGSKSKPEHSTYSSSHDGPAISRAGSQADWMEVDTLQDGANRPSTHDPSRERTARSYAGDADSNSRLHHLQQQVDALMRDKTQLKEKLSRRERASEDLQRQLRDAKDQQRRATEAHAHELRAAHEEALGWKARAEGTSNQLQAIQSSHQTTKDLLALRTNELTHAQTFLSKADNVSHAQVLDMVGNLNTLGLQLAALLTENTVFPSERPYCSPEAKTSVENLLGKGMLKLLASEPHEEDPILVQVALQAMISGYASHLISLWDAHFEVGRNVLLTNIYNKLFDLEPQAVSARWRALVHRCIKELNRDAKIDHVTTSSDELLQILKNVIAVAGGVEYDEKSAKEMLKKVRDVVEQCFDVQRVVGEDVASTNFEVVYPAHDSAFFSQAMEDLDDGGRGKPKKPAEGKRILCTAELGLKRREKTEGPNGGQGSVQVFMLLKAKVLLPTSRESRGQ